MNVRKIVVPVVCLASCAWSSVAQQREDPARMYERIYAIVPMIGAGTKADPRRPMFVPTPQQIFAANHTGVIAFNQVTSDDGNSALVELVMATKTDLATVKAQINAQVALTPSIQLFDRASTSPLTVETAFKLLKKNFDITKFAVIVP